MTIDQRERARGKVVRFGLKQVGKPTPLIAKTIFRGYGLLAGIWVILPQELIGLNDTMYGQVNRWVIVGYAVIHFVIKFFGWDFKPDR